MALTIVLCGSGKMSEEVIKQCSIQNVQCVRFKPGMSGPKNTRGNDAFVAVHFGRGLDFPALIRFCEPRYIPIFQASSANISLPKMPGMPIITAPNLCLDVVRQFNALHIILGPSGCVVSEIIESHRPEKVGSATALEFASIAGVEPSSIVSVRDWETQKKLGVKEEDRDKTALHIIRIHREHSDTELRVMCVGRTGYAEGLLYFARNLALGSGQTWTNNTRKPVVGIVKIQDLLSLIEQ